MRGPVAHPAKKSDRQARVSEVVGQATPAARASNRPIAVTGEADPMDSEEQAQMAQRLTHMLNTGVLQDAVSAGLEDQGQFRIDTLDLLGVLLESAGLVLAPRPPESLPSGPDARRPRSRSAKCPRSAKCLRSAK